MTIFHVIFKLKAKRRSYTSHDIDRFSFRIESSEKVGQPECNTWLVRVFRLRYCADLSSAHLTVAKFMRYGYQSEPLGETTSTFPLEDVHHEYARYIMQAIARDRPESRSVPTNGGKPRWYNGKLPFLEVQSFLGPMAVQDKNADHGGNFLEMGKVFFLLMEKGRTIYQPAKRGKDGLIPIKGIWNMTPAEIEAEYEQRQTVSDNPEAESE